MGDNVHMYLSRSMRWRTYWGTSKARAPFRLPGSSGAARGILPGRISGRGVTLCEVRLDERVVPAYIRRQEDGMSVTTKQSSGCKVAALGDSRYRASEVLTE
jgi:anti-sigma factor RsiW